MKIPTVVMRQAVDPETGEPTVTAQQYQDNLNQQMQKCLSDDGFVIPARTTDEIRHIAAADTYNGRPDGTIWYDSNTNQWVGRANGILVVFTTTPL